MALDDKIQSKRIGSYQNSYILKNRVNVQVFKNIYKKNSSAWDWWNIV